MGMFFWMKKDTQVNQVYGVLPFSRHGLTTLRMALPWFMSALVALLVLQVQPFYNLPLAQSILLSLIMGLSAPLLALAMAVLARNKIPGLERVQKF